MYSEIFLADFAVFHVFLGISRDFADPRLREISEALYKQPKIFCSACYCLVSNHSDYYYLAWQAYVCYLVVVQKPRILKNVAK